MKPKSILVDVMLGDHYECQVSYPLRGYPLIESNGEVVEIIDENVLRNIIETKKPSLKNKNYHVAFTNQRV